MSDRRKPVRAKRRPGTGRARAKTEKATYASQAGPPDRRAEALHLIIESAPNAIVVVNGEGAIVFANAQTAKFFGYDPKELIGLPIEQLVPARYRGRHRQFRVDFHTDPGVRPMGMGRDLFGLRKDGSEFPVEIGLSPVKTDADLFVLATIVDISERKQAQEALREQATLARLGQMAAVVAHEVKNPLAGIRGALQVIAGKLPAEGRERAVIGDIQARIDSLNEMMQDLLTFARPRALTLVSASVRSMLDGTATLLRQYCLFSLFAFKPHMIKGSLPETWVTGMV